MNQATKLFVGGNRRKSCLGIQEFLISTFVVVGETQVRFTEEEAKFYRTG